MSLDTTTSDPIESAESIAASITDEMETPTEAVIENEDTSQTSETVDVEPDETEEATDNSDEAELKEWAASKNLPLDDPIKLAKMYRESEKQLGKKGQKEGQLRKAVETANVESGADDTQALNNRITALEFYLAHPDARQYEEEMVSILEDKPWLANDLEVVLDAARGRSGSKQLVAERQAGKKEGLAAAEKAGRAAPPRAGATNTATAGDARITPANVDEVIGRHMGDTKWYKAHEAEINKALAG